MNNDFFGHEWGDLPIVFTSDEITTEIHWKKHEWPKIVTYGTNVLFYFVHAILCPGHTIPLKTITIFLTYTCEACDVTRAWGIRIMA